MNGIVEILIGGQIHTLRFGVQACMLFQDIAIKNALDPTSKENEIKLMGDLFYCGLFGAALRQQKQAPTYDYAMSLFDDFSLEDSFAVDQQRIWTEWSESKWGSSLIALGKEALKKKVEELESQL